MLHSLLWWGSVISSHHKMPFQMIGNNDKNRSQMVLFNCRDTLLISMDTFTQYKDICLHRHLRLFLTISLTIRKFGFWTMKIRVPNDTKTRFLPRFLKTDTTPSKMLWDVMVTYTGAGNTTAHRLCEYEVKKLQQAGSTQFFHFIFTQPMGSKFSGPSNVSNTPHQTI